jgi:hypothetical protein
MAVGHKPPPVLRLCSCLAPAGLRPAAAADRLVSLYGPLALVSPPFPFDVTDYYEAEMGPCLERTWFCFESLCGPETLPRFRRATGRIEAELAEADRRRVNLDPGYLDHSKLVLASLKPAPDKIYMGHGVWAHTCARYGDGRWSAPSHSFPDFQDGRFDGFLAQARRLYRGLLRSM